MPDTKQDRNLHNISPDIIRNATKTIEAGGTDLRHDRAETWNKLLHQSEELGGLVVGTLMQEQVSQCSPAQVVQNHLQCVDFGFHVAMELVRAGKVDKETAERFTMGFGPRHAA